MPVGGFNGLTVFQVDLHHALLAGAGDHVSRGVRLPYGVRTGVDAVDRLNIVAHDHFQEIIDEANKPVEAPR